VKSLRAVEVAMYELNKQEVIAVVAVLVVFAALAAFIISLEFG
jgi:hypothetical protein